MSLPLQMQMEIDISAMAHKREIAEGFAKLRTELLPAVEQNPQQKLLASLQNALSPSLQQAGLMEQLLWGANQNAFGNAQCSPLSSAYGALSWSPF